MLLMVMVVVGSRTALMVVVVTVRLRTWLMMGLLCWRDRRAMLVLCDRGWGFTRRSLVMVIVTIGSITSS